MHERERFCCSPEYGDCPTLRMMLRLRRPLTEDEYLAIYMPPGPNDAPRREVERDLHNPSWHAVVRDGRRDR